MAAAWSLVRINEARIVGFHNHVVWVVGGEKIFADSME
jgi:hypothetical protein